MTQVKGFQIVFVNSQRAFETLSPRILNYTALVTAMQAREQSEATQSDAR